MLPLTPTTNQLEAILDAIHASAQCVTAFYITFTNLNNIILLTIEVIGHDDQRIPILTRFIIYSQN